MAKYSVTIRFPASCVTSAAAQNAVEALKKFLDGKIVKASLLGYGIQILGTPEITFEKK
jgi:hypothetical protein